jgi:hypothetical protein
MFIFDHAREMSGVTTIIFRRSLRSDRGRIYSLTRQQEANGQAAAQMSAKVAGNLLTAGDVPNLGRLKDSRDFTECIPNGPVGRRIKSWCARPCYDTSRLDTDGRACPVRLRRETYRLTFVLMSFPPVRRP